MTFANDPPETLCRNCGQPIHLVRYTMGPEWRHGRDAVSQHGPRHCETTVAEPPPPAPDTTPEATL